MCVRKLNINNIDYKRLPQRIINYICYLGRKVEKIINEIS